MAMRWVAVMAMSAASCTTDPPSIAWGYGNGAALVGFAGATGPSRVWHEEEAESSSTTGASVPDEGSETRDDREPPSRCANGTNAEEPCTLDSTGPEGGAYLCGNGHVDAAAEDCEPGVPMVDSCARLGFQGGTLACSETCEFDTSDCAWQLSLSYAASKRFDFGWTPHPGAEAFFLEESLDPSEPFVQVGGATTDHAVSLTVPLHLRVGARYRVRACRDTTCRTSNVVTADGLTEAVGHLVGANTEGDDWFGISMALSDDGRLLAVGAWTEDSPAHGDPESNAESQAGAVYMFTRDDLGRWTQVAMLKASDARRDDTFGTGLALSADGSIVAVGASAQDGAVGEDEGGVYVFARAEGESWVERAYIKATQPEVNDRWGARVALDASGDTLAVATHQPVLGGDGLDPDRAGRTGYVVVYVRDADHAWSEQATLRARVPGYADRFGISLAMSADGNTVAVGADAEDGLVPGVNGDEEDDSGNSSGAAYVFTRDEAGAWSQQAYLKASRPDDFDRFGYSVALDGRGRLLAVGAREEDSQYARSGAVYVFTRDDGGSWTQASLLKASHAGEGDYFGAQVAVSRDGGVLAIGSNGENGRGSGVAGDASVNDAAQVSDAGAAYVFTRDDEGQWQPKSYVKAPQPSPGDEFGTQVALDADGHTLVVGAPRTDTRGENGGAVYVY